jgi:hypothetical protein
VKRTEVIQLAAAGGALVCAVLSWLAAGSAEQVPPILDGQPSLTAMVYYPPLVVLALALLTVAGVLAVLGLTRLRASRRDG